MLALAIILVTGLVAWGLLFFAGVDHRVRGDAKSYGLPSAHVDIDLQADGTALVTDEDVRRTRLRLPATIDSIADAPGRLAIYKDGG